MKVSVDRMFKPGVTNGMTTGAGQVVQVREGGQAGIKAKEYICVA